VKINLHMPTIFAEIDDDLVLLEKVSRYNWMLCGIMPEAGKPRTQLKAITWIGGILTYMDELLLGVTDGTPIKHLDGDGLNYRLSNLELQPDAPKRAIAPRGYAAVQKAQAAKAAKE
jgi:hypothetical protein